MSEAVAEKSEEAVAEVAKPTEEVGTDIPNEDVNYDAKASKMGWVPQDEWHGDPKMWRPAKEFVERGENIIPILNDRVKKLEADLAMTAKVNKKELDDMKLASYERAKAEYDKQLVDIRAKETKAFEEGDLDEFDKIREERESIKPPEEVTVAPESNESPEFAPWLEKNQWYKDDNELHLYADNIGEAFQKSANEQGKSLSDSELYEKVGKAVRGTFPEKFTNPRREEPSAVEAGTDEAPSKGKGNTFDDLPATAKAQYKRMAEKFKMQNRTFSKEQYATTYFED